MKRTVLVCCECYAPTKKLNWYRDLAPFECLWHPDYQHPLCSTSADLGHYCEKFCPGCACLRSFYLDTNNLYHVMVDPILLHPDYNSSVRHIEQAIIANAHLPVDQQDRRYRGACAESTGISPSRAHDLGIRLSHPCVRRDVSDVTPLVPDVGTQKPDYVSPLPTSQGKSIMLETGYTEVDIENAMSINGDDFVKSFKWLRDHCVRDHSDESDEADDMFDGYGDGVGYGDDDFDY